MLWSQRCIVHSTYNLNLIRNKLHENGLIFWRLTLICYKGQSRTYPWNFSKFYQPTWSGAIFCLNVNKMFANWHIIKKLKELTNDALLRVAPFIVQCTYRYTSQASQPVIEGGQWSRQTRETPQVALADFCWCRSQTTIHYNHINRAIRTVHLPTGRMKQNKNTVHSTCESSHIYRSVSSFITTTKLEPFRRVDEIGSSTNHQPLRNTHNAKFRTGLPTVITDSLISSWRL